MQIEEGAVLSGKVTGLTKFGAFVELEEGATGMVHISEVSNVYVEDIKDHLSMGQEVRVKVLSMTEGKISLSIKRLLPAPEPQERRPRPAPRKRDVQRNVWQGVKSSASNEPQTFEDMMSKFKQVSDEKMTDLKRSSDSKRSGGYSRRGGR